MDSISTCPGWAADLKKLLHSFAVHGIALPVASDSTTRFIPVQTVTKTAGVLIKLDTQLWEQHFQIGHIIR